MAQLQCHVRGVVWSRALKSTTQSTREGPLHSNSTNQTYGL